MAKKLLGEAIGIEEFEAKLRKDYAPKLTSALPATQATRYLQIESRFARRSATISPPTSRSSNDAQPHALRARCKYHTSKGTKMKTRPLLRLLAVVTIIGIGPVAFAPPVAHAASKEAQRAEVRKVADQTLRRLYKFQPGAKQAIQKSAGYAVFSNFGMKILVLGGGKGEGVAVNNETKQETFMKMLELQAGLGFGIKKFRLVWVFETPEALNRFVNSGWELGAQTTAAAQLKGQGAWAAGAMSISPGVWVYQLTDNGLALELTAKGTKYFKDDDLN